MASIERGVGGVAAVRRDDVSQNCAKYPILAKSKKVIAMTMREDALLPLAVLVVAYANIR